MPTIESELSGLREQISKLNSRKARAEVEIETAVRNKNEAAKALKEEFKVTTVAEATELKERLEKELEKELAAARQALAEAGA